MIVKMIKKYSIDDLKENTRDFNRVQALLNGYDIKFNVVFFKDILKIGVVTFGIDEKSENYNILMENGFNDEWL